MRRKEKDGQGGRDNNTLVSLMRNKVLSARLRERINSV